MPGHTQLSTPWWFCGRTDGFPRMCSCSELCQIHIRRAPGLAWLHSQCPDRWQRLPPGQSWVLCPLGASHSKQGGCSSCTFGKNHWSPLVFGRWPCLLGWLPVGRIRAGFHLLVQHISSRFCRHWVEVGTWSCPLLPTHHSCRGLTGRMR